MIPFYTRSATSHAAMHPEALPNGAECYALDNPAHKPFFTALLAANHSAFAGALTLPGWVLLDCYLLPSAVVGFADKGAPVAAYTALPSAVSGQWIGISLFSLIKGAQLGLRTKAMALAFYGAKQQWGIAQFGNASLRVHSQLGHLRLMSVEPPIHSLAQQSFVYLMDVPALSYLQRPGRLPALPSPSNAEWICCADEARMQTLRRDIGAHPGRFAIVHPGARAGSNGQEVLIADLA